MFKIDSLVYMNFLRKYREYLITDVSAGIIVFFVALPLCLGISLASGAPLFSGIIAGVVGGIVVGALSGSQLGVSGPAAGLAVMVYTYVASLGGSFEAFLLVVILAGLIQLICGYLKFGSIAYYFPSSVITGMLAGIGLLIIIKQIPNIIDYNDLKGFFAYQKDTATEVSISATLIIALISIAVMILWEFDAIKKRKVFVAIQAPFVVVVMGIMFVLLIQNDIISLTLEESQMVKIPKIIASDDMLAHFMFPDFSQITNPKIYVMALLVAVIASLETLLCAEATDKLDPQKRITPTNRELKAQGIGNIISGLCGGLPITQVIVRSSANITFGAKTKLSTIVHGFILLLSALLIADILNMIPLASLAAVLILVGYKLTKPSLYKRMYKLGSEQFVPFLITVFGVVVFDLLKGVGMGMIAALGYVIYYNLKNSYHYTRDKKSGKEGEQKHIITLAEEVSFLNKGEILQMLHSIPNDSEVIIDGSHCANIHHDVLEVIKDFYTNAKSRGISLQLIDINFKNV